ncbi:hypothetical protein EDB83DRAFT_2519892 [Lactarius deliciosus]|nr:hypothetical protein EDB83DRAFT_2519892 [Lactarius deliciosus]
MLEAESSSSDTSSDTDSSSDTTDSDSDSDSDATDAEFLPVVGATTAAHHLRRPVLVGTSRVADATTVAHHHHLAPGGMMIEGTTRVVVMDGTVGNRLRGIVGAGFRIQGRPLVGRPLA